jgi:hypothetical protein
MQVSGERVIEPPVTITSGIHRRSQIFAEWIEKRATLLTSQLAKGCSLARPTSVFGQKILCRVNQLPVYLANYIVVVVVVVFGQICW